MMTLVRCMPLFLTTLLLGWVLALSAHAISIDPLQDETSDKKNVYLNTERLLSIPDKPEFSPVLKALEIGDLEAAREALQRLKSEHPKLAGTWELDGAIKLASGDSKGAVASLRRALVLAPNVSSIYTKLGAALLAQNKVTEGQRLLTKALELDGKDPVSALLLGRIKAAQGELAAARKYYEIALSTSEGFSKIHQELAELYLRHGEARKAVRLVEPFLDQSNPAPHLIATRAYLALNEGDRARATLADARELGLDPAEATLYEAVFYRLENNFVESEALLKKLVEEHPGRPLLLLELATTYAAAGKNTESRTAALRAIKLLPETHTAKIELGSLLLSQGYASDAIQAVAFSIDSNVSDPKALLVAIRAGLIAGNIPVAEAASLRLLDDFPRLGQSYTHRMEVLLRQGKIDQALAVAQSGTETLPGNPTVWPALVSLLLRQEKYQDAAQAARQGLASHPDSTFLKMQLANALQESGHTEKAERLYRELSQDKEAALIALNNLANLLAKDPQRLDEALLHARKAKEMAPGTAAVNDTLGWILHLEGTHDEAWALLDLAHTATPNDLEVLCHLGIVDATVNGVSAARENLKRCASQNTYPDLSEQANTLLHQ